MFKYKKKNLWKAKVVNSSGTIREINPYDRKIYQYFYVSTNLHYPSWEELRRCRRLEPR